MILSTCGASAVVLHTTSFAWRAAWAPRTSHKGAVVARMAAVRPACCKMSRRVSMMSPSSLAHPRAFTSLLLTTEEQKHDHQQQMAEGYSHGIVVTTSPTPPDTAHR